MFITQYPLLDLLILFVGLNVNLFLWGLISQIYKMIRVHMKCKKNAIYMDAVAEALLRLRKED